MLHKYSGIGHPVSHGSKCRGEGETLIFHFSKFYIIARHTATPDLFDSLVPYISFFFHILLCLLLLLSSFAFTCRLWAYISGCLRGNKYCKIIIGVPDTPANSKPNAVLGTVANSPPGGISIRTSGVGILLYIQTKPREMRIPLLVSQIGAGLRVECKN